MSNPYKFVTIDNPNISILEPNADNGIAYGKYTEMPSDSAGHEEARAIRSFDMYMPNFSLREYKGHFDQHVILNNLEGNGLDMMGVCLILKGQIRSYIKDRESGQPSFNYSQNFKYDPDNDFKHWITAGKPFHIAHFSVKPDYFLQALPRHEAWAEPMMNMIEKRVRISGERFMPIISAQERAMQNIFDCPLEGKLAYMMMETSVVQIILLQMHAMFANQGAPYSQVSTRDKDLIYAVRDYISQNFLDDHSLSALARHFATNTNKLMSLFKRTFGESIFDFIAGERMLFAKEILRDENHQICEVSRMLGYKNANHFSTAFKKKFGISPSEARR